MKVRGEAAIIGSELEAGFAERLRFPVGKPRARRISLCSESDDVTA
jgi:hypothetical protein